MRSYIRPTLAQQQRLCRRPGLETEQLTTTIKTIFDDIAREGDQALRRYTERFDGVHLGGIRLSAAGIKRQASRVNPDVAQAIDQAYRTITAFHATQLREEVKVQTAPGVTCWQEPRPIENVGLYVPGGSAPLISTVLMLGIPAKLAGCRRIAMVTPPTSDGLIDPALCYAAIKVGITDVFMVGGAQAIAALALGTESVPRVDKIFGPGNQYVTAAKQQAVSAGVAIDMPAGPSEVMVLADADANPAFVAADLLSQAEHGPDSQVVLATTSQTLAQAITAEINAQVATLPRRRIAEQALSNSFSAVFGSVDAALTFANRYAPEHLILAVDQPQQYVPKVVNAGSVFLGAYTPESAGDYASGTNHTLPTNGWARSYGGVSVASFQKQVSFQTISQQGLRSLGPTITTLAQAEGLDAHARAVTIRTQGEKT